MIICRINMIGHALAETYFVKVVLKQSTSFIKYIILIEIGSYSIRGHYR